MPEYRTYLSEGDLSAKQYYFVKQGTAPNSVVVCSATTDEPIGVVQNDPVAGGAASVCIEGHTKVSADAAMVLGAVIGTSADGQAATYVAGTDTTKYGMGKCTRAAANAGEIGEILLRPVGLLT